MSEKDVFGFEMPPWARRLEAETEFRDGDPLAIDACVLACHDDGAAIPDWTVEELARRARINLGIDEDPSKKGGR